MAGTMRINYPSSIRPIRIRCSARVSSDMVMRALGKGSDGVLIVGCHLGECEYDTGVFYATKSVEYLKQVAKAMGIEPERIQMAYCSAAEGERFQKTIIKMDSIIKSVGPSPIKKYADDNYFKAQERILKKTAAKKTSAPKPKE
jgi:F420-non-reducing hydrogenase iron-sulfur subunit